MTAAESRDVADATMVGRFEYSSISRRWRWDETAALLHGGPGRSRSVTTDQLLELVHAEDRERIADVLGDETAAGLRLGYRVPAPDGTVRSLLVVADEVSRHEGGFQAAGVAVDITAELREAGERAGRAAVAAVLEGRGAIEQAKGVLMLVYSLSEDQAFALLRWWSRNHNLRVRLLAERLMATVRSGEDSDAELRVRMDRRLHDLTSGPGA